MDLAFLFTCGVGQSKNFDAAEDDEQSTIEVSVEASASSSPGTIVGTVRRAKAGGHRGSEPCGSAGAGEHKKSQLAIRKDAPVIKTFSRGSLAKALAAGRPANRKAAMARLREDEVAQSGIGPRASRWRTRCGLHRNWLGDEPVLPLTMHSLAAVIAQLKEGQYGAAADYVSTAKSHHLKQY